MTIPLPVLQFAAIDTICQANRDGGITPATPIAWHETADEWIIVYEDGRKIRHSTPLAPSKRIEASGAKTEPHNVPVDTQWHKAGRTKESRTEKKQDRRD